VSKPVTVRALTDDAEFAALNEGNPMGWQATWWWRDLKATMDIQWFTGLVDEVPAGFAAVCPLPVAAGGRGFAIVHVLLPHRRLGVGSALREAAEDAARGQRPGLIYSYVEGETDSEAAVRAWGLPEVGRHHESVLDLTTIDRAAFESRATASGVSIDQLPVAEMDEAAWRSIHAFTEARFGEAPDSADGGGDFPYAAFRDMVSEPWMLLTASEGGELCGVTQVIARPGDEDAVNTFFTGVAPTARGRGIATALKSRHALVLAERGSSRVFTQNMEGNDAILAANRTLGFVRASGYVDVVRELA
jgi:GNAT superfamily N-acetyltransferase